MLLFFIIWFIILVILDSTISPGIVNLAMGALGALFFVAAVKSGAFIEAGFHVFFGILNLYVFFKRKDGKVGG